MVTITEERPAIQAALPRRTESGNVPEAAKRSEANRSKGGLKRQDLKLGEYVRKVPTASPDALCKDLLSLFEDHPDCECIVIADDSGAIGGLAMRNRFSYKLAHRYSVALFYNKPALHLVDREPVIVSADTDPRELIDLALSRQGDSLYDCIVLTSNGRYAGVLTVGDLMKMSKMLQLLAVESQNEMIGSAKQGVRNIVDAVGSVRESSKSGDALSQQVVDLTLQGNHELAQISESFQSLEQSSQMQVDRMKELQKETGSIGDMSRLIKELADQCNLLAINASIEAARAGEYGKGFGVVAAEFTKLADQTRKSAVEITAITTAIVGSIESATAQVEDGGRKTSSSKRHLDAAHEAFHHIFNAAANNRSSVERMGELADEAHRQAVRVKQDMERLQQSYTRP